MAGKRGRCGSRKHDEAIRDFSEAIRLNPEFCCDQRTSLAAGRHGVRSISGLKT